MRNFTFLFCLTVFCLFSISSNAQVVNNITQTTSHPNLQDAITNATAGDELNIVAGTFTEAGQIVIDKNLIIRGAGIASTILQTDQNTGTSADSRGWWLVNAGISLTLSDLTLDGSGFLIWQGIRHIGSGGSVDNVRFTNIKYNESGPTYQGTGIAIFGSGPVNVSNSIFDEIGRIGTHYFGASVSGSVYSNNTYTGKGAGDHLDYALDINNGAQITVSDNTITNNLGFASSDGSKSAGIIVGTFLGAGTMATITGNIITNNQCGIAVGFDASDASTVVANNNDVSNNVIAGISNTSTTNSVDGTLNWWGKRSGPSGAEPGSGSGVDENVVACPWLTGPPPSSATSCDPFIEVPTLSQWGLIILALLLMNFGVLYIKQLTVLPMQRV